LQISEDLLGGRNTGIGADEQFLKLVPCLLVDLPAVEEARDVAEPAFPGAFQRLFCLLVRLFGALEDAKQRLPPCQRTV
jgi:hypothetical protein